MDDCETLLKSRINEAYVKTLGRNIELSIIDSFNRQNRSTIDEIKDVCSAFGHRLDQAQQESIQTLSCLRTEIKTISNELAERAL
jgi:hypothetical protein